MQRMMENAEEQLISYIQQFEKAPLGWQAVHLHLSKLAAANRKEYNIRIALNGLNDLTRKHKGRIFLLANYDVMLLVKGAQVSEVNEAIFQTKFLFQEDPLAKRDDEFSTWFDLSVNYEKLTHIANVLLREKLRLRAEKEAGEREFGEIEPLDPNRLFKLQKALSSVDLSGYLRRQPVCVMATGHKPEPVFEEIYVRIADLQRPLMPNVNLFGNRWLFQHLTQTLDLGVLALLTRRPKEILIGPTSLNLNVDTLLSQSFLGFDEALHEGGQHTIVIELQPFDVFADVGQYEFGREFLRNKGYRILLDGLTVKSFPLFDRERLDVDLMKLVWDETMQVGAADAKMAAFAETIDKAGANRVILSRCDDERAIQYGYSVGINMFQGRYIDQVVHPGGGTRN